MKKFFMAVIALMMTASVSAQFYIYLSNGEVLQADSISTVAPTPGMLSGEFSVSDTKKVHFSKGNLQATYDGSSWTWSFATNQWDYIGNAAANNAITGNGTVSSNGTVDLFGWSTTATNYGIHNSQDNSDYSGDFIEWGNNPITNGGNKANMWHTLDKDEWGYLFQTRTDASNKFGAAKVNGKTGIVLLPDNWTLPSGCDFTPGITSASTGADWSLVASTNIYEGDDWTAMEKAGAVFLPAAGNRSGSDVGYGGSIGYYWSATPYDTNKAYFRYFDSNFYTQHYNNRYYGFSVRLVR